MYEQSWLDLDFVLLTGDNGKVTGARGVRILERKQFSPLFLSWTCKSNFDPIRLTGHSHPGGQS